MSEKMNKKRKYSERHVRRLIEASTNEDLEKADLDVQPVESSFEDSSSTSNTDNESNSISIEGEQRVVSVASVFEDDDNPDNSSSNHSTLSNVKTSSDDEHDNFFSDTSNNNSESDNNVSKKFREDVAIWAIEYNVPQNACNSLLNILRKHTDHDLPKNIRTLLKTPRKTNVRSIGGGSYCHFGLSSVIQQMFNSCNNDVHIIRLLLNIDGLPISKSSNASLWPILCSNDISNKVYIVGAYYGFQKPTDSNEFLEPFVNELNTMINYGFHVNQKQIQIRLHALVCDAPAKSFVLAVKSHTGYYSCTKCTIEGTYRSNRVCFPRTATNPPIRTNEEFARNLYEDYQTGYTILNTVPHFGPVTSVPCDYLHLVCFGAVKKLILLWMKSGPFSVRLSAQSIGKISQALVSLRDSVPNDFARKPRALSDVRHWKATEFRNFLLYTAPVVLKDVLKEDVYSNFITLHVAITILANPILCTDSDYIDYADALLDHFVISVEQLYGEKYVSHNIHNLLHLSGDVRIYGPLDAFSAFRFENFMSAIKKLLRKSEKPLEQLARRYHEIEALGLGGLAKADSAASSKLCFKNEHCDGPLAGFCNVQSQYKIMSNHSFNINCDSHRDNCCILKNGDCIVIENIIQGSDNRMYIVGKKLKHLDDLYCLPCVSSKLDIRIVSVDNAHDQIFRPIEEIKCKVWKMPYKRNCIIVPVIHTM